MAALLLLPLGHRALRRLLGPQVDTPTQVPARSGVICNGRNDGASGGKRRRSSGGKSRRVDFQGPTVDDALWYEGDKAPAAPSTSSPSLRPPPSGPSRPQHSSPASSRGAYQRTGNQGGNGRRGRGAREDDDEDEGDVRGWWEKPEERNLQSFAPRALEQWQEERLQLAYSTGRRKANIQELARELDLDRAVVLAWFKEFSLRPAGEREAILTARRGEDAVRKVEQASRDAAEAATGQAKADARIAEAATGAPGAAGSGFIPYFTRKQLGADKTKRISGEALRTLESIYDRTPFPSGDVVRGLYELHRLSRDVVVTLSKREMAALRSSLPSPNKYKGRQLAEKMGIKSSDSSGRSGGPQIQIQDVQYVQEPEAAPEAVKQRLKASWRRLLSAW
eukprot:XP_001699377.1 predicted protein [Chlamydomonas reinhardtii]